MKKISFALAAHVDAGKTTLAEALLHACGAVREPGRVDKGSAALDTGTQEKSRGITVFAGEASLRWKDAELNLLDTPGHVDFSPETERVLAAADAAVLVISGLDGVQAHTHSLWKLLEKRSLPVLLFVSKMDAGRRTQEELLKDLRDSLSEAVLPAAELLSPGEEAALLDESLLERLLAGEALTAEDGLSLIRERKAYPVFFGSGLKEQGVVPLLDLLAQLAPDTAAAGQEAFGAIVYKISYDEKGNRLTHLKCLSGELAPRDLIGYPDGRNSEKLTQIRRYTGSRYTQEELLSAGSIAAVTGLAESRSGDAIGCAGQKEGGLFFAPVMRFTLHLPDGLKPEQALLQLKKLEEEDPSLRLCYAPALEKITADLMGPVQGEVLIETVKERFGWTICLEQGKVLYRETLSAPVEGVGHYEPLRHYAEVHLAIRPLPRGSGIVYRDEDKGRFLAGDMRRLILGQLAQKKHKGVLTGSELADVEIALLGGRFHEKHTEGGDFREAAWRAVRQGLMQACREGKTQLLEPYLAFTISVPPDKTGRVLGDIQARSGRAEQTGEEDGLAVIIGRAPYALMQDYAALLASFTRGRGRMQARQDGYDLCHNTEEVVRDAAYNAAADREDPPDSVFCRNGGGFSVPWDKVPELMHLPYLAYDPNRAQGGSRSGGDGSAQARLRAPQGTDEELEAIMLREFGPIKRPAVSSRTEVWNSDEPWREPVKLDGPQEMIVDGYNLIFAWPELKEAAEKSLDLARERLEVMLQSYAAFTGRKILLVFDGWRVAGNAGSEEEKAPLTIIYTAENETADMAIEKELSARQAEKNRAMPVVVSNDNLIRLAVIRTGGLRLDCASFTEEYREAMRRLSEITKEKKALGEAVLDAAAGADFEKNSQPFHRNFTGET
ncbi:MAG: NYN domain-containing protein [Lachnospiraceae bacterium]|nr:NYN domain-containing protein [Lachnospiraceae bacterium]